MSSLCSSCRQTIDKDIVKKRCPSCEQSFCSSCLYQRIPIPRLNYQMQEVCTPCFHSISTQMMLQKPPKGFLQRLEQHPPEKRMPVNQLDPETKALEDRLQQLRMDFPASSTATKGMPSAVSSTPDDLLQQMHDELAIQQAETDSLATRLRILHETMPAATPDTVVLPSRLTSKDEEEKDEDEEYPWCTVCNDNATKRCLECDELFCESCVKKIHRQSGYKNHQFEVYKPSAKAKKKYNY